MMITCNGCNWKTFISTGTVSRNTFFESQLSGGISVSGSVRSAAFLVTTSQGSAVALKQSKQGGEKLQLSSTRPMHSSQGKALLSDRSSDQRRMRSMKGCSKV